MSTRPGPTVHGPGGVALGTDRTGPTDAPLVLALHGVGSSRTYLHEAVVGPLLAQGWQVACMDLRGHGAGSPVPDPARHSLAHHTADVAWAAEALAPTALVGVSLGGHAAVAAVAGGLAHVERLVAVLPAWTGAAPPGVGPHAATATEVRLRGVAHLRSRVAHEDGLRPWLRRALVRDLAAHDDASLRAALVALDGAAAPDRAAIAGLQVPLGVVGWPDDPGHPLAVAEEWAATAPHGRLATLTLDDPDTDPAALGHRVAALLGPAPS